MATSIEEILGRDINSIKELREEIKRLQDSIANVDPATQEFKDTTTKLIAAQQQLTSVTRASKDENVAATDSIVGMEKQYKSLYNTYKMLTEEQRNSSFGKEMESQLNSLSQKLNETKKGVGNFKDNIGHYSESVIDAFSKMGISVGGLQTPLKLASGGIKTFAASLKALIANPVGAIIMAIVVAFKALKAIVDRVKEAINSNEESQMALSEAMSAFQPILDAISNAWDAVGQAVVKFIGFIGDAVRWIREAGAAVTDFLGITKGANAAIKEQNELYKSLAQSQNALTKQKREYQKLNAKDQAEVERLREEASELENGAEKRRLLNEAKAKQAEIDARNVEIAKEELRILTEQSKLTANDAAMNDKLAAAEAKVAQEEANAARNARTFNKALKGTKEAADDAAGAARNLYNSIVENSKDEITKLDEKYKKEKKLLEKYGYDTTLLTKQYEEQRRKIVIDNAKKMQEEMMSEASTRSKLNKTIISNMVTAMPGLEKSIKAEVATKNRDTAATLLEAWGLIPSETDSKAVIKERADKILKIINDTLGTEMTSDMVIMDRTIDTIQLLRNNVIETLNTALGTDFELPVSKNAKTLGILTESLETYYLALKKLAADADSDKAVEQIENFTNLNKNSKADGFATALKATVEKIQAVNKEIMSNPDLSSKEIDEKLRKASMSYDEYVQDLAARREWDLLQAKQILEKGLADEKIAEDKKVEMRQQYLAVLEELQTIEWDREKALAERKAQVWEDSFNTVLSSADAVNTILESIVSRREAEIDAQVKEGKISEQTANKQKKALLSYQKVMTAVEVASVAASTAAGIMGVWKAYALEKVANAETAAATGPAAAATLAALNAKSLASAILQTAGLAATGAAQITAAINGTIAKVASVNADASSSSSTGVAATPAPIESEPYTYSRTLQTPEDIDELQNRPLWISVVDIESGLNRVQIRDEESSF